MRCKAFLAIVEDLDREGALDATQRAQALDHASRCTRCSLALAEARALSADLQELAARTQSSRAPQRLEHALRAAVRQRAVVASPARAGSSPRAAWSWMPAAVAALVVVGLLAAVHFYRARAVAQGGQQTTAAAPRDRQVEPNEGFVALGYAEPCAELDSLLVVRVQLTGASLAGLGWPLATIAGSDPIQADVIIGEDGVARAIRLVQ